MNYYNPDIVEYSTVEGFCVARTRVPHEGPKGIERRGCMRETKRAMKHGDGVLDMPESTTAR
jgi:hypothetical protein